MLALAGGWQSEVSGPTELIDPDEENRKVRSKIPLAPEDSDVRFDQFREIGPATAKGGRSGRTNPGIGGDCAATGVFAVRRHVFDRREHRRTDLADGRDPLGRWLHGFMLRVVPSAWKRTTARAMSEPVLSRAAG